MQRFLFIFAAIIVALTVVSRTIERPKIIEPDSVWNIAGENAEALSGIYTIDGKLYVYDKIPCYSSATKYQRKILWFVKVQEQYVNCRTCQLENGHPHEDFKGVCTSVRRYTLE